MNRSILGRLRLSAFGKGSSTTIELNENAELELAIISISTLCKVFAHFLTHELKNKGYETGGILTGLQLGETLVVTDAYAARKIVASHVDFTIPPEELVRIDRQRREDGEKRFVGIYHLHPGFGSFMSQTDVNATQRFCGFYGPSVNLVVSTSRDSIEYKLFTVKKGVSQELPYKLMQG